jgi:hypothetical protein
MVLAGGFLCEARGRRAALTRRPTAARSTVAVRLYKFLPLQFAIADLALRRLKVARLADLNDPFEFYAARIHDRQTGETLPDVKSEVDSRTGLLCFSRDWQNPVLWSHYADRHRGMSLGFDVRDEDVRLVDYTADRLDLPERADGIVAEDIVDRLIVTKYEDWGYEQEARVLVPFDRLVHEGGVWFREFDARLVLREVRLGARCTLSLDQARRLVEPFDGRVPVLRTRLAWKSFRIVDEAAEPSSAPV